MQIEEHRWYSPAVNKEMALKVYGHWGVPLLVFPCSLGRYYDYEGMGMIEAISDHITAGRVKLFCVDSLDAETWYNFSVPPRQRHDRHEAYDRYIVDEVIPFVRSHCRQPEIRVVANGCSMGAYHAVNFFLKHPDLFAGTIALSGLYRLDRTEFGLAAADIHAVYFNSPLHYLPGLGDPWFLEWYRQSSIVVCAGQGAWENEALEDSRQLVAVLQEKRIPAWVDIWGHDVDHDWPWWFRQMDYFLTSLY
jgi:esterase/lipase superfamily enzyme